LPLCSLLTAVTAVTRRHPSGFKALVGEVRFPLLGGFAARPEIPPPNVYDSRCGCDNTRVSASELQAVHDLLVKGRDLVSAGWLHQRGYADGLSHEEAADFSRRWSARYSPTYRPDRDAVDRATRILASVVYSEDDLPAGIPPIVILSNWNERPERTQADVIAAYTTAIARVTGQLEARQEAVAHG
jgi:hypothetical protein